MATFTREYKNSHDAQLGMRGMGQLGFTPLSVTGLEQHVGIGRFALLGIFAFAFQPKAHVVVTYSGVGIEPSDYQVNMARAKANMAQSRATFAKWRNGIGAIVRALNLGGKNE